MDYDVSHIQPTEQLAISVEHQQQLPATYQERVLEVLSWYGYNIAEQNDILKALELTIPSELTSLKTCVSYKELVVKLNDILQANLRRAKGSERQHLVDKHHHLKLKLEPLFTSFKAQVNNGRDLENKILLGGAEKGFKSKLDFLINEGKATKNLYILGSDRPLWLDQEPAVKHFLSSKLESLGVKGAEQKLELIRGKAFSEVDKMQKSKHKPKDYQAQLNKAVDKARADSVLAVNQLAQTEIFWPTEMDMIKFVIGQNRAKLSKIHVEFVTATKPVSKCRADASDTFKEFVKTYSDKLSNIHQIAVISSQPFSHYRLIQGLVAFTNANIAMELKPFAKEVKELNYSEVLDTIAATIDAGLPLAKEKAFIKDNELKAVKIVTTLQS